MNNKMKKTEYLLREIGEIDDRLLHEAICYKPARRSGFKWGVLAACLAFVFILTVVTPMLRAFSEIGENDEVENNPVAYESLDALLTDSVGYYASNQSVESLGYTDSAKLVWQEADSKELYVCYLSEAELARLQREMGRGEEVGERSPELNMKVWVLDGEGNVRSPYLKPTVGNTGCEIFDYEAEIMPTESLIQCISEILS